MSEISTRESSIASGRAPKRTRICGPQSKNGCFTCKRRRIKCDEEKPSCQRCRRSKFECEGYPERPSVRSATKPLAEKHTPVADLPIATVEKGTVAPSKYSAPTNALIDRYSRSSTQDRLARVGVNLLSHGLIDQFDFTLRIFDGLLPQLSYAIPSVNSAAAALGAIYELQSTASSTGKSNERNAVAATQYGLAIRALQQDLEKQRFGGVPLLMTCMLLACAELLLRRRSYSLMHIQAGFKILEERRALLSPRQSSNGRASQGGEAPLSGEDELFLLFRTFDIHSSTYADRRMPTMPAPHLWSPPSDLSTKTDSRTIGLDLISTIHSCLYFTSTAGQYKYLPASHVPTEIFIEQGRHLGVLNSWLSRLDRYVIPKGILGKAEIQPKGRTHLLMLRNMCLSTIVFASTILSPYETAWDDFSWYFEEIVAGAEEILAAREHCVSPTADPTFVPILNKTYGGNDDFAFTFTPLPGVIQPLCLTAFKYRHSTYRRRAAELMRRAGREGPWIGELVAAVADRLIQVEEAGRLSDLEVSDLLWEDRVDLLEEASGPSSIPEGARISGVGMDANVSRSKNPNDHDSRNWTARRSGETRARFFKCRDVEGMLDAGMGIAVDNGPLSDDADNGNLSGERPPWKNEKYWEDWNEVLEF